MSDEGYPGIAHDMMTLTAERDALAARCEALSGALREFVDIDADCGIKTNAHAAAQLVEALHKARAALALLEPKQEKA